MGRLHRTLLGALLLGSLALNLANNDFSLYYHGDERTKIDMLLAGRDYYRHPALMRQSLRLGAAVTGSRDPQVLVETGRAFSAMAGTLAVLGTYLLGRAPLGPGWALAAATVAASLPLLVIHAHYVKEDIYVTGFGALALWAAARLVRSPDPRRVLVLGLFLGLAVASKYVGLFLLVPLALLPWLSRPPRARTTGAVGAAVLVAALVYLAINPGFAQEFLAARRDVGAEVAHALRGHGGIRIDPWSQWLGFHLVHSVGPGATWPIAALALLGAGGTLLRWRARPLEDRLIVLYGLGFYLLIEASPLKPWPGFVRYAVPLTPAVAYLAVRAVQTLAGGRGARRGVRWGAVAVLALATLHAATTSTRLVIQLADDTRDRLHAWLRARGERAITEGYGSLHSHQVATVAALSTGEIPPDIRYLVASSFTYDRYAFAARLPGQAERVYWLHARYQALFRHPGVVEEIRPRYRSFGFGSPTIRIIDVRALRDAEPERPRS